MGPVLQEMLLQILRNQLVIMLGLSPSPNTDREYKATCRLLDQLALVAEKREHNEPIL